MKTTLFTLFTFIAAGIMAQEGPGIEWQQTYNFTGSGNDEGNEIIPTTDGGYIVVGNAQMSSDGNDYDVFVVKINSAGETEWQNTYGGTYGDYGSSIKQTPDGGYIVAGATRSVDGDVSGNHSDLGTFDYWVLKLNSTGEIQWQRCFGGTRDDWANKIILLSDGGYALTGITQSLDGDVTGWHGWSGSNWSDYWVIKLDSNGELVWQKSLGGTGDDNGKDLIETSTGDIMAIGYSTSSDGDVTDSHGSFELWLVKLSGSGTMLWQKAYGGGMQEEGYSIEEISDGYIMTGLTASTDGDAVGNEFGSAAWVLKVDDDGEIIWQKTYGGGDFDFAYDITQTEDEGFIMAATTASGDGQVTGYHQPSSGMTFDYWVVKLDGNGNLIWQNALGGSYDDTANSILETTDGNFIVAGTTNSYDGDVTDNPNRSIWVVKVLGPDLGVEDFSASSVKIYPNPAKDILNFSEKLQNIQVYSLDGKLLIQVNDKENISVNLLQKGTYIIKAETVNGTKINSKFIKN